MFHFYKNTALLLCLLFITNHSFSQIKIVSVNGIVVDKLNKLPIEFATVKLINKKNIASKFTTITTKNGTFKFDKIEEGQYTLALTYIGFQNLDRGVIITSTSTLIDLGTIEMQGTNQILAEVNVTSKKALQNNAIDRKVYNVSQDIMAQSGTASDILKNVPSVEVDIEGGISLRGSGDVMVLINGRPSPLMGKNKAEVLQQIPANTIERIEVITNPSARFRPDGTSGIINIVMKKNTKTGFNGNIIANVGNHERANSSLNLNLKKGKFNVFATYNIRRDERNRFGTTERSFYDSIGKNKGYYADDSRSKSRPLSHLLRGGFEYTIDDKNSVGLSASTLKTEQVRDDIVNRNFSNSNHQVTSLFKRLRHAPAGENEKDATFFWQHNFKEEDHQLRVEATASSKSENEKNYYSNIYSIPFFSTALDNNWVNQIEKNQQVTVDYIKNLNGNAKMELGYAGSFVQQDIDFYVENYDSIAHKFVKNLQNSNRFLYDQNIHALYGTYQKTLGSFSFSTGLRAEKALTKSNLVTKDSIIKIDYFQLYPTVHLAYKLKKSELQLNYSRRVNRPQGDDLNPFSEIIDPLNLRAGNPKLLPEYIHSVEFGYQWKNNIFTFVPSIYYRYKYNGFTTVTKAINDSVLLTTKENLSYDRSAGLELILSAKPSKIFTANLSANVFYNTINAASLGFAATKSIVSLSTTFNSSFEITPVTMLQLTCNYKSARQTAQGLFKPTFVVNAGARQDLLKKKLSVTVTVSDLFKTLTQKVNLQSPFLQQVSITNRDARILYIGCSYRFGSTTKKRVEDKLQFDNAL